MVKLSLLFATLTFPHVDDDYYQDNVENIVGLAEWFHTVPDLFLLLMGKNAQMTPFAIFANKTEFDALAVDAASALQRWQQFKTLALATRPTIAPKLAEIDAVIQSTDLPYWVLSIRESQPPSHIEPTFKPKLMQAHAHSLQQRAAALDDALGQSLNQSGTQPIHPLIQAILDAPELMLGYWSDKIIARKWDIDYQPIAEVADLADLPIQEVDYDHHRSWVPYFCAYFVEPKGTTEKQRYTTPRGLITAYGRWLVPFEQEMDYLFLSPYDDTLETGWFGGAFGGQAIKGCQLFDANGNARSEKLHNRHIQILNEKLVCFIAGAGCTLPNQLLSLPDFNEMMRGFGEVTTHIKDGFYRYTMPYQVTLPHDNAPRDENYTGLWDEQGNTVLPANTYANISKFHKTKKIALVTRLNVNYQEEKDSFYYYGTINRQGKVLIPCQYKMIFPAVHFDKGPNIPKQDVLLAITDDNTIHLYKSNGTLVKKTQYQPILSIWYAGKIIDDNGWMLVSDGAFVGYMDCNGENFTPDTPLDEYNGLITNAMRDAFGFDKQYRDVSLQALDDEAPWEDLRNFCHYLCLGNATDAQQVFDTVYDYVHSDDAQAEHSFRVAKDQPAAAVLPGMVFQTLRDMSYAANVDWKDTETIANLYGVMSQVAALQGAIWHPDDNSEGMSEGIAAQQQHARQNGVALFTFPNQGDSYEFAAIRLADKANFITIAGKWGVHFGFENDDV